MTIRGILTLLAMSSLAQADLAWVDVDAPAGATAPYHLSLPATAGTSATNLTGVVFTLFGSSGNRDRGDADPLLSDFAFADGAGAFVGVRMTGLPAGTWNVESWHYDAGGFAGAIQIEVQEEGNPDSSQVLANGVAFSTAPASYQITSDGVQAYEFRFREDDGNHRARFNGLRIRAAGSAPFPPFVFVDAREPNTQAVGGAPDPFYAVTSSDPGYTSGPLWWRRQSFGFDVGGNTEVYEKDANGGMGDAALLQTTITGLTPGETYAIYVAFLSVPNETWQVKVGLRADDLTLFHPVTPAGAILDLGLSSVPGSNRNQYLGFVGNVVAAPGGTITVYVDDGDGTSSSSRSWYEGLAYGQPIVVPEPPGLPAGAVEVAPDGAWTWFNDERSIFHQGSLYTGYVRADGHVGLTRFDPVTATSSHMQLSTSRSQQKDDHNNPSLTALPDGRLLAVYSKHSSTAEFYVRTSTHASPSTDADWTAEQVEAMPRGNTYANTYRLSGEADTIFNFHRCINFNPTLSRSFNNGQTWDPPIQVINTGSGGTRPYPRYVSDHDTRIDFIYTDGHPRDVNNSIYHLYYETGAFRKSDGTGVQSLGSLPIEHDLGERGTVVYAYNSASWGSGEGPDDWIPSARAWTWDIHYGPQGHPVCVFQVQRDNVTGSGWNHDRIYYYYARYDGVSWTKRFIAQAGRGLYESEDDYGGGISIDPENPDVVYLSSNAADPFDLADINDVPLQPFERYELYRGVTSDGGVTFSWKALTSQSAADNLRPIVPQDHGYDRALVWFYGTYNTYKNYQTQVLARLENDFEILSTVVTLPEVELTWGSRVGARYDIVAGTSLPLFHTMILTNIPAQGPRTTQSFPVPANLANEPFVYFRVESEPSLSGVSP